jgi:hypothetical protein
MLLQLSVRDIGQLTDFALATNGPLPARGYVAGPTNWWIPGPTSNTASLTPVAPGTPATAAGPWP